MGIIIGKLVKKKSTYEVLEKLDGEIQKIEDYRRSTEQWRKKIVGRFLIAAILIYLSGAVGLYFYYDNYSDTKIVYFAPLVAFPFIIFMIRKVLTWYYARKLRRNEKKLEKYMGEKKKILENVMEKETYKVAKQILDKFGGDIQKPSQNPVEVIKAKPNIIGSSSAETPVPRGQLDARNLSVRKRVSFEASPMNPNRPVPRANLTRVSTTSSGPSSPQINTPKQLHKPLVRPLLKQNRSIVDKLVDYLLDDGPSKRYALICKRCCGHNGMAHQNEVDYLAYDCSYCFYHNLAPKKRSMGPSFEASSPSMVASPSSSDSSDSGSEEDPANNDAESEVQAADSKNIVSTYNNSNVAQATSTSSNNIEDGAEINKIDGPIVSGTHDSDISLETQTAS